MTGSDTWGEEALLVRALEAALHTPARPLTEGSGTGSPGAYALLYAGTHPLYRRARFRPSRGRSLADGGGWVLYVGSAAQLGERRARHRGNFGAVADLDVADLWMVELPTRRHGLALALEAELIAALAPVWCQPWMAGAGSRHPGARRATQARSAFCTLHPGRTATVGSARHTADDLAARVVAHLERTVPSWW